MKEFSKCFDCAFQTDLNFGSLTTWNLNFRPATDFRNRSNATVTQYLLSLVACTQIDLLKSIGLINNGFHLQLAL